MPDIRLIASRHSAFYSPLISMIAGGFLEKEGLTASYTPAAAGQNSAIEVAEGRADIGQSAVSGSWGALDAGEKPPVAHFAQINAFDGFIVAAREPDADFRWEKLLDAKFLYVHGGQPQAMLKYGLHRVGIDLSDIEGVESSGGDEMMEQWRNGEGDYFHEQGAFPQQLEHEGSVTSWVRSVRLWVRRRSAVWLRGGTISILMRRRRLRGRIGRHGIG